MKDFRNLQVWQKAHYYPEDKDFLLEFEEYVTHYDALFTEFK